MSLFPLISTWKAAGGGAIFNPATLPLSGWWRDFANPTTPIASAGSSGTNGNLAPGTAPTFGSLNGHPTAIFNGSTQYLASASNASSFLTGGATPSALWILARSLSQPATSGFPYSDPCLLCLSLTAIRVIVSYSSSGATGTVYNGGYNTTVPLTFTNNAWTLFQLWWDGIGTTSFRLNNSAGGVKTLGFAGPDSMAGTGVLNISTNYDAPSVFANCEIAEIGADNTSATYGTSQMDNIRAYINNRYALSI